MFINLFPQLGRILENLPIFDFIDCGSFAVRGLDYVSVINPKTNKNTKVNSKI